MSKQIQDGKSITMTATAPVKSGEAVQIGAGLFGVAASDAGVGELFALITEGVHPLPCAVAITAGDIVYLTSSGTVTNVGAANNIQCGVAISAGTTTSPAHILLNKGGVKGASS